MRGFGDAGMRTLPDALPCSFQSVAVTWRTAVIPTGHGVQSRTEAGFPASQSPEIIPGDRFAGKPFASFNTHYPQKDALSHGVR